MKFIVKTAVPSNYTNWRRRYRQGDWRLLSSPAHVAIKQELAERLRMDQGWICCYCESRIDETNSHIEHLKSRKHFPQNQLDWNNFLSSCNGSPAGESCGHKKGNSDSATLVSPIIDPSCERRFIYTGFGEILPANPTDLDAKETILLLGLNTSKLRALRRNLFIEIECYRTSLNDQEFSVFIETYLRSDDDGQFREFWTVIRYVASGL